MWYKISNHLIRLLAGKRTVVVNATLKNGSFYIEGSKEHYFYNVFIENNQGIKL